MPNIAGFRSRLKDGRQVVTNPDWVEKIIDARHASQEKLEQIYYISGSLIMLAVLAVFSFLMGHI